jgi:hypothetical protein
MADFTRKESCMLISPYLQNPFRRDPLIRFCFCFQKQFNSTCMHFGNGILALLRNPVSNGRAPPAVKK